MKIPDTPKSRSEYLPDLPFAAHVHQVNPDMRLHYVEAGPEQAPSETVHYRQKIQRLQ